MMFHSNRHIKNIWVSTLVCLAFFLLFSLNLIPLQVFADDNNSRTSPFASSTFTDGNGNQIDEIIIGERT